MDFIHNLKICKNHFESKIILKNNCVLQFSLKRVNIG